MRRHFDPAAIHRPGTIALLTTGLAVMLAMLLSWGCTENTPSQPPDTTPPDETAPAAVGDLAAVDSTASSITLVWTAPGDDDTTGTASSYDIRYSRSPINPSLWAVAQIVKKMPTPGPAGSRDVCTVINLDPDTEYYFALKTSDERSNWSGLSNVVHARTSPSPSLWSAVDLPLPSGNSAVVAVDFTGNYGMAMALALSGDVPTGLVFFSLQQDGSWLEDDLGDIRAGFAGMDLALDVYGKPVLAGFQMTQPYSVVVDLRGASAKYIEEYSYGMLTVDGDGSFMVAGGRSSGGGLWTSTAPGIWHFDDLPLTGTNDSGFFDVCVRGDRAVASGYDDGADTLNVILTRTTTTNWQKIEPTGSDFRTLWCIALAGDGTIFLAGIEGAGGPAPTAFLARRAGDGSWSDMFLPDPDQLSGVRDILIARDGSLYLACAGEGSDSEANLVHVGVTGAVREMEPFSGVLFQVGQAADDTVYAVGFRRDTSSGAETGVMLVRDR